eukprot:CAMPEP_0175702934 /NCGR_PEP_ID=MMETSP0097-20121207/36259_1 /TAXON_ID=311494 /ORGANISM="Alexandrium monilatum, Strain CCMP3105" /LENGTH=119 /DNA_ID=CAMNT_0017010211 /DNA_START=207 /DNA_END=563 /DNA_ORIENTATION=+
MPSMLITSSRSTPSMASQRSFLSSTSFSRSPKATAHPRTRFSSVGHSLLTSVLAMNLASLFLMAENRARSISSGLLAFSPLAPAPPPPTHRHGQTEAAPACRAPSSAPCLAQVSQTHDP